MEDKEGWHTFAWYVVHSEGTSVGKKASIGFSKLQASHQTQSASHESISERKVLLYVENAWKMAGEMAS